VFEGMVLNYVYFSLLLYDDPILFPGQVGKLHLHTFFGNTRTSANSTALSIAQTGNSTCAGRIANRSAYWVPTLIDSKDGTPIAHKTASGITKMARTDCWQAAFTRCLMVYA
jgi:Domain of unknown function (DUF1996)